MKNGHRRSRALDFGGYKYLEEMSRPQRAAHALDWAASNFPQQFVAYNVLVKAIFGFKSTPRLVNNDVIALRKCLSRIRTILQKDYGRGLVTSLGQGVRATVDSADQLKNDVPRVSRRLASASTAFVNSTALVDISAIPATKENKPYIDWYKTGLKSQLALLNSPDFQRKLLPPQEEEPEPTSGE